MERKRPSTDEYFILAHHANERGLMKYKANITEVMFHSKNNDVLSLFF